MAAKPVLIRRTLPAMAIVAVVFAVTQIAMSMLVRPHLVAADRLTTTITDHNLMNINMFNHATVTIDEPGAWITSQQTIDGSGHSAQVPSWFVDCNPRPPHERQGCFARLADLGYRQLVTYQPAGHFWKIQMYETAVYLTLAVTMAALCTYWIRRLS